MFKALQQKFSFIIVLLSFVAYWLITLNTQLHAYYVLQLSLSAGLFICYGFDKFCAIYRLTRVPEVVLHSFALLGGYLGGFLGRICFRHKTRKVSFTIILLMASAIHLCLMYWLCFDALHTQRFWPINLILQYF